MYASRASVLSWVSQLGTEATSSDGGHNEGVDNDHWTDDYESRPRKRRRYALPSPPHTATDRQSEEMIPPADATATPGRAEKRRWRAESSGDASHEKATGGPDSNPDLDADDATPRNPRARRPLGGSNDPYSAGDGSPTPSASWTTSSGAASSSQASSAKRRRKSQGIAMLAPAAPKLRYLNDALDPRPPAMLHAFAEKLQNVDLEKHFVWPELQAATSTHPLHTTLFHQLSKPIWYSRATATSTSVPEEGFRPLGPCPSCDDIQDVIEAARECENEVHSESQWNCAVHYPLLRLAVRGYEQALGVSNCTSATIAKEYQRGSSHGGSADAKKVDFCLTLRKRHHPRIANVNNVLCESINHTNHTPYLASPIALSIETKGAAPDQEEAQLQIGTWLDAHFACLRKLVRRAARSSRGNPTDAEEVWRRAVDLLGFLPAVIVLQHRWTLVFATWAPDGITLWRRVSLGSTDSAEGICQILFGLRTVATWAEETYWPWFERWALGVGD
ncbi:hypothetical protein GQ53DRAFT_742976 [Thozetella sp. PMI_491]|nr:hypothetical protein GQ53DRAFT_742976 [Thozetella sp. PMI_491]